MHYGNLVVISAEDAEDIDAAVAAAMGPSEENGGFWEWWQIGGRWTGALDGYDPEKDPANQSQCSLCLGSGRRPDAAQFGEDWIKSTNGCNGCNGSGTSTKWPTQYARHAGDIAPIESVTPEAYSLFYRVILAGTPYSEERYEPWHEAIGERFVKQGLPPLDWIKQNYGGYLAVVVDNRGR